MLWRILGYDSARIAYLRTEHYHSGENMDILTNSSVLLWAGIVVIVLIVLAIALSDLRNRDEKEWKKDPPKNGDELGRLWAHGLNEDKNYNDRLTFFVLFHSFLISGVLNLYRGASQPPLALIRLISLIGILLSLIWMYVQVRQGFLLEILRTRLLEPAREFGKTIKLREVGLFGWISATMLLSYFVPFLIIVLWLVIIWQTL